MERNEPKIGGRSLADASRSAEDAANRMTNLAIARRIIIGIAAAVCFGAALVGVVGAQSAENGGGGGPVAVARMDSPIDGLAKSTLNGWIRNAEGRGSPLLIIELDTPGGRLDSAREIANMIMDSPVPVAVLVTPSGRLVRLTV